MTVAPVTAVPSATAAPAEIIAGSAGSIKDDAASLPAKSTTAGSTQAGITLPPCVPEGGGRSNGVTDPVRWLVACRQMTQGYISK